MKSKAKGFTLIEVIVVIAIISILAGILVPSLLGYVQRARIAAAIADAKTIKTSVENSLMTRFVLNDSHDDTSGAFNKRLIVNVNGTKTKETVGAFTNTSWYEYKHPSNNVSASQAIDKTIAQGLDETFSEKWSDGNNKIQNPLTHANKTSNCAAFLKRYNTNFGLVVVYNQDFSVRLMQIYRKGILVTYVNNEYIANASKNAYFIGTKTWDNIYTDVGRTPPDGIKQFSIHNKQIKNGKEEGWI